MGLAMGLGKGPVKGLVRDQEKGLMMVVEIGPVREWEIHASTFHCDARTRMAGREMPCRQ
jgi:hypothetical protein